MPYTRDISENLSKTLEETNLFPYYKKYNLPFSFESQNSSSSKKLKVIQHTKWNEKVDIWYRKFVATIAKKKKNPVYITVGQQGLFYNWNCFNFENTKILSKNKNYKRRLFLEMVHIERNSWPIMFKTNINNPSQIYCNILE